MISISFIIPTIGRSSLQRTLDSIEQYPGDEVIVVEDIPPSRMWGNPQRNDGMKRATGDYLAFIDDDDWYVAGHRLIMEKAANKIPFRPILFRMQYPNGDFLWKEKRVTAGNIGSPMIFVPNSRRMLHYWQDGRNMADYIFCLKWKWPQEQIVWREEVIAMIDHDPAYVRNPTAEALYERKQVCQ